MTHSLSTVLLCCAVLGAAAPPHHPLGAQAPPRDSTRGGQAGTGAGAGAPDSLSLDSLRARLARAEAAIALLREQLAGESESAVHTRSRFRLEVSAQLLANAFGTFGRVNNIDVPQTALAPPAPGAIPPTNDAAGFTVRQTRFGAAASVDNVAGATFAGDVDFDLFGGVQNAPGDRRLFPEPRIRTARARLIWPRTELMVGAETPLISDLNPLSLASVGIPDFSAAGNLWNWLAQVRLTQAIATMGRGERQAQFAIQAAIMTPFASQVAPGEPDAVDAGERSRRPAFEGRARLRWGGSDGASTISEALIAEHGGEIGVGVHQGWLAVAAGSLTESRAVSVDAHAVIAPRVEIRGEAYSGRLLRGLGGGAIAQNFGAAPAGAPAGALGPPIRDVAGWAQLNGQPHPALIGGVGCGIDRPNPDDSPTRLQNTVCAIHADWRPAQPLLFGVEYRRLATRFSTGTFVAHHVNFVFGFEL